METSMDMVERSVKEAIFILDNLQMERSKAKAKRKMSMGRSRKDIGPKESTERI